MAIEGFQWTDHAEQRLQERRLVRGDVEQAIRDGHGDRQINDGRADWLLVGRTADGVPFEAATTIPPTAMRGRPASSPLGGWTSHHR